MSVCIHSCVRLSIHSCICTHTNVIYPDIRKLNVSIFSITKSLDFTDNDQFYIY